MSEIREIAEECESLVLQESTNHRNDDRSEEPSDDDEILPIEAEFDRPPFKLLDAISISPTEGDEDDTRNDPEDFVGPISVGPECKMRQRRIKEFCKK